jgi:hypothetical protein
MRPPKSQDGRRYAREKAKACCPDRCGRSKDHSVVDQPELAQMPHRPAASFRLGHQSGAKSQVSVPTTMSVQSQGAISQTVVRFHISRLAAKRFEDRCGFTQRCPLRAA